MNNQNTNIKRTVFKNKKTSSRGEFNTKLLKKLVNTDDSTQWIRLKITGNGVSNILEMSRYELYNQGRKLYDYGSDLIDNKEFSLLVSSQEKELSTEYFHTSIDWNVFNEQRIFNAYS